MAYTEFKPTIWSKYLQLELDKRLILADSCNRSFQGEAGRGKTVKIIGAAKPSLLTYGGQLTAAETLQDSAVLMPIDQLKATHVAVDDVDQAQSDIRIMEAVMKGSAQVLAQAADTYIASLAANAVYKSASTASVDKTIIKTLIDAAFVQLWNNDVNIGDDVVIELSPWAYSLFQNNMIGVKTDNVSLLKSGVVGYYNGAEVKMTNNLYETGGYTYMFVRTKNAIAFADGIETVETYRPGDAFSDNVKALYTFGAKIVRPKELYVIVGKTAS